MAVGRRHLRNPGGPRPEEKEMIQRWSDNYYSILAFHWPEMALTDMILLLNSNRLGHVSMAIDFECCLPFVSL